MRRANGVQDIIPPCPRLQSECSQNRAQHVSLGWNYAPSFPTVKVKLSCDLAMNGTVDLQPEAPGLCGCRLWCTIAPVFVWSC